MRTTASFLIFALLVLIVPLTSAKQTGDWEAVEKLTGLEIAFKTRNGATRFGILHSADDSEIRVLVASKKYLSGVQTPVRREEVEKVWRASLRFNERSAGRGALIGAGIGAGAGVAAAINSGRSGDGQAVLAIPAFAIYGAGIGAVVGLFVKKKHKKEELIYSIG